MDIMSISKNETVQEVGVNLQKTLYFEVEYLKLLQKVVQNPLNYKKSYILA